MTDFQSSVLLFLGKGITLTNSDKMLIPNAFELNLPYKKYVPCHRLDKETGGLVICAKTRADEVLIKNTFRYKYIYKKYVAIVAGKLQPKEGFITSLIGGKHSVTRFGVVHYTDSLRYGTISTVELFPITGTVQCIQIFAHS